MPPPPPPTDAAEPEGERLQKVLARAGLASRRASEELIAEGRVRVNGEVAELGRRVDPEADEVTIDGVPVPVAPGLVHYLLNKPPGVVTTASDPQGRPVVVGLVPDEPRVFPVGRLDVDTEGLLVLTNDGGFAHRLTHPSFGVDKEYLAEVEGTPTRAALRALREGVDLVDGRTAPARVTLVSPGVLRLVISEGRNRQVRRMCEAVGHPVRRLVRTRIGPVADRRLAPGSWRPLSTAEVRSLEAEAARGAHGGRG
jgi:23S rRNA pseudouridine2605 synthase